MYEKGHLFDKLRLLDLGTISARMGYIVSSSQVSVNTVKVYLMLGLHC